MAKSIQDISWEAEEYIQYNRNVLWYIGLFAVGIGLCVLSYFLQWWSFIVLIVVCIIAIIVSVIRPPRKIQYSINKNGLKEGNKLHKFEDFRAFGILKEGSHFSAILIPKKRFALQVKVYFPGQSGEAIVDVLGNRLPMEDVKPDLLDKIVSALRI